MAVRAARLRRRCCTATPTSARRTHRQSAAYLDAFGDEHVNPSDLAFHLTRRARGLPFWFALVVHGTDAFADAVGRAVDLARRRRRRSCARSADPVRLVMEPELSVVLFERDGWTRADWDAWAAAALADGLAFVAPTTWHGRPIGRLVVPPPAHRPRRRRPTCSRRLALTRSVATSAAVRSSPIPGAARELAVARRSRRRPVASLAPGTTACMLPAAAYLDDAVLAWERTHLFADAWVCAGRAADLAAVGARRAVEVGDDAVLLVRGDDGVLRGFYNVCRTAPTSWRRAGDGASTADPLPVPRLALRARRRACWRRPASAPPRLRAAPSTGWCRVPVEEWHGWVMVNASRRRAPLASSLDGIEAHVADHEPERLVVGATHTYELAANWKLVVENYQECVHCPSIHPELCRVSPPRAARTTSATGGSGSAAGMDLAAARSHDVADGGSPRPPLRRLRGDARRRVDYLVVLPNLLVSLHPDYVMTHRIEPLAPDRTAVECQWLFAPRPSPRPASTRRFAVEFWDLTNRQDWAACESVQRGLRSRGFRPGPFSTAEDGVAQFTRLVAVGLPDRRVAITEPGTAGPHGDVASVAVHRNRSGDHHAPSGSRPVLHRPGGRPAAHPRAVDRHGVRWAGRRERHHPARAHRPRSPRTTTASSAT